MAARWYNPATGQFTSKDATTNSPVPNSPVPNSANANPFAYGNDNPLTNTDSDEHRAFVDGSSNPNAEDAAAVRATFAAVGYEINDIIDDPFLGAYSDLADQRCGGRMNCYYGKLRELRTVSVDKSGKLIGNVAAVSILNRVLGVSSDQSADGTSNEGSRKSAE